MAYGAFTCIYVAGNSSQRSKRPTHHPGGDASCKADPLLPWKRVLLIPSERTQRQEREEAPSEAGMSSSANKDGFSMKTNLGFKRLYKHQSVSLPGPVLNCSLRALCRGLSVEGRTTPSKFHLETLLQIFSFCLRCQMTCQSAHH